MKANKGFMNIYDKIQLHLAHLCGVVIAFIALSVAIDVMIRKFFNASILGVVECAEHGLVFITFLSAAWILKQKNHVKNDLLINMLGPWLRAMLNCLTSTIGAVMCLFLFYRGLLTILDLQKRHIETVSSLELPMAPLYIPICIGALMLVDQFARQAFEHLSEMRKNPASPSKA